jgi:MFS family permease
MRRVVVVVAAMSALFITSVAPAGAMSGDVVDRTWQWIFWLNVPVGLLAVPLVLTRVAESRGPAAALDLPGLALAAGAAFGLTWGLVRAGTAGWGSAETLTALAAGAVLGVAFVAWALRAKAPMLPLRLFRSRAFSAGNAVIFFLNAALTGAIFFTAQLHQVALGAGPLEAGLRLLPWGIVPFLIAPRAGALADRIGERPLIVAGNLLMTAGMGWLALLADPAAGYLSMVVPMALGGLGFSLAVPAATMAVVSRVAPPDIGRASGTFSTTRQLGGAFGIAILGAAFAAAGGYASPRAFTDGYAVALACASALTLAGAVAGALLPPRARQRIAAPAGPPRVPGYAGSARHATGRSEDAPEG